MSTLDVQGVIVPLVTPFTDDMSAVGEVRLARLIRRLMESHPAGFLVGGDIGEFPMLTASERKTVLEIVMRETSNAVPVLVNVSTVGTMAALDLAQHAKRHGARAVVAMPPYYGHFVTEEMFHHLRVIANYSDSSVLVVDPQKQLTEDLKIKLKDHGAVKFPQPLATATPAIAVAESSTTDEFSAGDLISSPVALFELEGVRAVLSGNTSGRAEVMAKAMHEHGKVRVAKALLQYRDLDVGPPRNPYQMSSLDVVKALESELEEKGPA